MRVLFVVLFLAVVLAVVYGSAALAQTRTIVYDSATVQTSSQCFARNADGSFDVRHCAWTTAADGTRLEACESFTVRNATRRAQLDALRAAGEQVWLARQAFGVDAGAP